MIGNINGKEREERNAHVPAGICAFLVLLYMGSSQNAFSGIFYSIHGIGDQLVEGICLPCASADKETINIFLQDQIIGIARIDVAAVQNRDLLCGFAEQFAQAVFDDSVFFLRIVYRCR